MYNLPSEAVGKDLHIFGEKKGDKAKSPRDFEENGI
jgi:hypothetical protein